MMISEPRAIPSELVHKFAPVAAVSSEEWGCWSMRRVRRSSRGVAGRRRGLLWLLKVSEKQSRVETSKARNWPDGEVEKRKSTVRTR